VAGKRPLVKPTCPPSRGCSSVTDPDTSRGVGSESAGMNGSLRALMTSVGTVISRSHGFDDARVQ